LEETWSELFLLSAIQYSISIDNQTFLLNRLGENEKLIKDIFDVFKKLKLDSIELICLKAIILFRFGKKRHSSRNEYTRFLDIRTLKEGIIIEGLQDQAQITLAQFTQIHNPTR
jgi:nuclear receptor subfamily 2 group E protein 1/nuclear receptor subfamily 2 group E protein 3